MKTLICLAIFFALLADGSPAEAQTASFTKVYYDISGSVQTYGIIKTPDSNFLLSGCKDYNPFALKIDPQGNIIWGKKYGSYYGNLLCLAATNDSDFILAGNIEYPVGSRNDILIIKITPEGDTLWSKIIDMGDSDNALYIKPTSDNGFILTGYSSNPAATPYFKSLVIKFDASGNLTWGRTFYSGIYNNIAVAAAETPDGGFLLTGSAGDGTSYFGSMLLMKLTSAGTISWSEKQSVTGAMVSAGNDLTILPDGILCYFTNNQNEMCLMKTDLSGHVLWGKSYGNGGLFQTTLPTAKLHQTSNGGYVFVNGSSEWGPMGRVVKVDSTSEAVWVRNLFLLANDLLPASNGGYLVAGNGPIMGVRMNLTNNPQIGIIGLDSSGYSFSCNYPETPYTSPYTVVMLPATLTLATAGIVSAFHPSVDPVTLAVDSGCVAFVGNIRETAVPNPLKVIPNPSDGVFRIELDGLQNMETGHAEIFNSLGELVFKYTPADLSGFEINQNDLAAGIYQIRVVTGNKVFSRKLVIVP